MTTSWRRGALMILSMLGKAKKEIISNNFDVLLSIGFGDMGKVKAFDQILRIFLKAIEDGSVIGKANLHRTATAVKYQA